MNFILYFNYYSLFITELCKALCVHGTCQVGGSPLCRCYPGYYGAMCEMSRARTRNRGHHKALEPRNILTGLKYTNNFLRPVITYSGGKSRRTYWSCTVLCHHGGIPNRSFSIQGLSSLAAFTKYGRCYKTVGGKPCAISYKGHMTREVCCNAGYGDGWGSSCSPCKSSVISGQ